MSDLGTQESKRIRKAAPPALEKPAPWGCLGAVTVWLVACLALFAGTSWAGTIILGLLAAVGLVGIVAWYLYGVILLAIVHLSWSRRGVRCLVVHSDSPAG